MSTIPDRNDAVRGAARMAAAGLALCAAGCGGGFAEGQFEAHQAVMEQIEETMVQLQVARASVQSDADLGEIVAALRVMKEPELPDPEPELVEPENVESAPARDLPAVLKLQGIIRHPTVPLAIINGRTLGAGETIARHRVERIGRDDVVLSAPDGQTVNLRLYETASPSP